LDKENEEGKGKYRRGGTGRELISGKKSRGYWGRVRYNYGSFNNEINSEEGSEKIGRKA